MALPRELKFPPISEALVDIRAAISAPLDLFEAARRELESEYPKSKMRRGMRAEFRVENGKLIPPTSEDLGFQGVWLQSADDTAIVQFRPDGFTFSNLTSYMGGDRLIAEALRLWSQFAARFQPTGVTRVALRYINQLRLPFRVGDDFSKFLTAAPLTPQGAPQTVSGFLSRIIAHDEAETGATVIFTQQLSTPEANVPSLVVIDVDAFRVGEFSTGADDLRTLLEGLRQLKNRTFFSLLTDDAVKLFL